MIAHRVFSASARAVGDREFRAIVSNSDPGRDGMVISTDGLDFAEYMRNPVLLYQHLPQEPIGRCLALRRSGDNLVGRFEFAPAGVSDTADRARGLLKASCLNILSIGFDITEIAPPKNGIRTASKAILLEVSVVSVPALPSAQVIERSFREKKGDRAEQLLESAARDAAEAAEHHRALGYALDAGTRAEADRAHGRVGRALRACRSALEEIRALGLPDSADAANRPPGGPGDGLSTGPSKAAHSYRPTDPAALGGWLADQAANHARAVDRAATRAGAPTSWVARQAEKSQLRGR